jgi:hypothetical protein
MQILGLEKELKIGQWFRLADLSSQLNKHINQVAVFEVSASALPSLTDYSTPLAQDDSWDIS